MRLITKSQEPSELKAWKKANPNGRYQDLDNSEAGKTTRQAIRKMALKEQFYLCAYCCKRINKTNSNNEHIASQHTAAHKSLDFANIVASCTTPSRCNQERGSKLLALTPLMAECETELRFYLSGKITGETERAKQTVDILGLDSPAIREERRRMVDSLLYGCGMMPNELEPPDDDVLGILVADLQQPDQNGQLEAFSPALTNILKQLLKTKP